MKQTTKENLKTLEDLKDRVHELHGRIRFLESAYGQSSNMPPGLRKNISEFSRSVILNNGFSCPFDVLLDDWKNWWRTGTTICHNPYSSGWRMPIVTRISWRSYRTEFEMLWLISLLVFITDHVHIVNNYFPIQLKESTDIHLETGNKNVSILFALNDCILVFLIACSFPA